MFHVYFILVDRAVEKKIIISLHIKASIELKNSLLAFSFRAVQHSLTWSDN